MMMPLNISHLFMYDVVGYDTKSYTFVGHV